MRVINNNANATPFGSNVEDMMLALVIRELQNLARVPELTDRQMVKFEKLWNMYYKGLKVDAREEYKTYILANGLKGVDKEDPFYQRLQALLHTDQTTLPDTY